MNRHPDLPRNLRRGLWPYLATLLASMLAALMLALGSLPAFAQPAAAPKGHALVAFDRTALRAAPREGGAVQAELTQGDLLEIRGQRLDHLQVYDHRRERAGFVRAESVRRIAFDAARTAELLAVVRFLRHTPGQEALGIAYVAAYLNAASAEEIGAEPFDALGTMAERLARRAAHAKAGDATMQQMDAVAAYGVRFATIEREGRLHLCYDGDGFRRALALKPDAPQQARAVLGLTRHDCIDPAMTPQARIAFDAWRADLLDLPWPQGYADLSALMKNRLHMRRAGLWAARAHQMSRQGRAAQQAADRALAELAAVNKSEFTDEDQAEYAETAIRVGAVRWAAVPLPNAAVAGLGASGLRIVTLAGKEPGQSCVQILAAERIETKTPTRLLAERCTFGTVWTSSASARPGGDALVLAVQPLEGWTELWVFRADAADRNAAWRVDVLPPATSAPGLGYIEFAGWVPGAQPSMLVARESRVEGRFNRRFEVLALESLDAVKQASTPNLLVAFGQHSDVQWRRRTVALR
jgi:hypothetical protein